MPTHQEPAPPFRVPDATPPSTRIKVVGVGGGGSNAIDRMIDFGVEGVEFIALNTDVQALEVSKAPVRGQLGSLLTNGLSAGSDPNVGRRAAIQDVNEISEVLEGADMVFVTAGLGGGTGTGAAPVIAAIASEMGALTVAIVTRPFGFEGKRRMAIADWGVDHLLRYVDTLIVIPNEKLLAIAKDAPFFESFKIADDFLRQAVQSITDIITTEGVINRDFADVKTTMAGMGYAVMGTASRSGPTRAIDAVMDAMASPLLEEGAIDGARGILINITGSSTLRLSEVNAASRVIQSVAHEDANIIFGAVLDERLGDEVKATVIATGFRNDGRDRSERRAMLLRAASPEATKSETAPLEPMRREAPEPEVIEPAVSEPAIAEPVAEVVASTIEELANETPLVNDPLPYQPEAVEVAPAETITIEPEATEREEIEAEAIQVEVIEPVAIEEEPVEVAEATFEEPEVEALEVEPSEAMPEQIQELAEHEDPPLEIEVYGGHEAPVEGPPERYSLEAEDAETVEIESSEVSHAEAHDEEEEDWREAIREIALLAEPTFKVEDQEEVTEPPRRNHLAGSSSDSKSRGFERNPRLADLNVKTHDSIAQRPANTLAPPRDLTPAPPTNVAASPHLSTTRRAAHAAYAAVSLPETEPETEPEESQTKAVDAFAQVLEARRRFVENLGKSLPPADPQTATPDDSPKTQELTSHPAALRGEESQGYNQEEPAEAAKQRQARTSRPLTIDAERAQAAAPAEKGAGFREKLSMALFTDKPPSVPAENVYGESNQPKPLPDANRRLQREGTEERNGELFESHWNSEIRVPTFGSISDKKR